MDRKAEKFKKVLEEEYDAKEEKVINDIDNNNKGLSLNSTTYDDDLYDTPETKTETPKEEKLTCKKFGRDLVESMKQIKNFSMLYWIVTIIVTIYFCCVYTFMNFAETLLNVNYGYNTEEAGR